MTAAIMRRVFGSLYRKQSESDRRIHIEYFALAVRPRHEVWNKTDGLIVFYSAEPVDFDDPQ